MNKPDNVMYNCLLDACIAASDNAKAMALFEEMTKHDDNVIDEVTYNTLFKGTIYELYI